MKWEKMRETFERDPWLKRVVFSDEWLATSGDEAEKDKKMRIWCECNCAHIMFRPFEGLNPNWRPIMRLMSVHSGRHKGGFDEFETHISCSISYKLVFVVKQWGEVESLVVVPFEQAEPGGKTKSFRWQMFKDLNVAKAGRRIEWIAVVRNVSVIEDGDYLRNTYDVYKFPFGFNPHSAGWHETKQSRPVSS